MTNWKEQITELLKKHPEGLTIKDFAIMANTSRHTVALALAELKGENKIIIRRVAAAKLHYWRG